MTPKGAMVPLGYGRFVRADRVVAVIPIERSERRKGRRTYVHVEDLPTPIVASRSEQAIINDIEIALTEFGIREEAPAPGPLEPTRRRLFGRGQPPDRRRG